MRFIISKGRDEHFEELKTFEGSNFEVAYKFLCSNASKDKMPSFEELRKDIETVSYLRPTYGFYINNDDNNGLLYIKVIEDES